MLRMHQPGLASYICAIAVCVGCFLATGTVAAENITSGAMASSGGLGTPYTPEADSVEWNPAALGEVKSNFQFLVTPMSGRLASDDWPVEVLLQMVQGRSTPTQIQSSINNLANSPDGELHVQANLSSGAYVTVGQRSLSATVRGQAIGTLSVDAATLILLGSKPGKAYDLSGSDLATVTYGDVRIAGVYSDPEFAHKLHIDGFHMGGTLRYLHGLEYGLMESGGSPLQVVADGENYRLQGDGRLDMWQSREGWGLATDLGLYFRLTPNVAFDVSILDLGRTWWRNVTKTTYSYQLDPQTGKGSFVESAPQSTSLRPVYTLPTRLRAGLSMTGNNGWQWSLQWARQLVAAQDCNDEFALTTQLNRLEALPVRFAVKYSGASQDLKFAFGLGVRLGPLTLDVGTQNLTGLLARGKDASLSVSTGLRF